MSFLDLRCPRCSQPLKAPAGMRVFVCDACGATSTPSPAVGDSSSVHGLWLPPRRILLPTDDLPLNEEIVLFPLWLLPLKVEAAATGLPERILVPAIGHDAFGRLVDSARRLSRARARLVEVEPEEGRPVPLPPPAELGVEEAYAVAEIVALGTVEGWPPDEEVATWEAPFGPLRLVDLPCRRSSHELVDLVFGLAVDPSLSRSLPLVDARGRVRAALERPTVSVPREPLPV